MTSPPRTDSSADALTLRRASAADDRLLADLNADVQGLHRERRPDVFTPARGDGGEVRDDRIAWFRAQLEQADTRAWIAELDGVAVGYVMAMLRERPAHPFCVARRWCELDQISVVPAARRRGVARRLITAVLEHARAASYPHVELTVWSFNDDARRVFERLGFRVQRARLERDLE